MNGGGAGRNQHIQFPKAINHHATVEADGELASLRIDVGDVADVSVLDFLVVVILDLHDLVAWSEGPAEALYLSLAGGVEDPLQLDVERTPVRLPGGGVAARPGSLREMTEEELAEIFGSKPDN